MSNSAALKRGLCAAVDALADELVALSHALHGHPEPAFRETWSSVTLAGFARSHGLVVEHPAYGLPTAFRASAGARGPLVVVCCEYDALPGLGHACGHNIVAAAGLGAVLALAPLAGAGRGRVVALGTPAEEGGGGKVVLLRRGAFDGASAALLAHPGQRDSVDARFRAAAPLEAVFRGLASHAAMAPQAGRNALDAAVLAHQALAAARPTLVFGDQVTSVMAEGGRLANVVPDRAVLAVLTRAETTDGLARLATVVRRAAAAGAAATGCRYAVCRTGASYRELRGDPWLARRAEANLRRLGRRVAAEGDRAVLVAGSSDLGNVSHLVPTIHPKLAITDQPQHSRAFAHAARSATGDRAVVDGAKALAMTALDVWLAEAHQRGGDR